MGLFDLFKKKPVIETPSIDPNNYLLEELKRKLISLNYQVDRSTSYLSITVNSELEIATAIVSSPDYHPSIIHLTVATIHSKYFPEGIIDNIVGIGKTLEEKVDSVIKNYLTTTLPPIMDSFSDSHLPEVDYEDINGILWHPKAGDLALQGTWKNEPQEDVILKLITKNIKILSLTEKINWVKIYVARQADGTITGECSLNNNLWTDGYQDIHQYAIEWEQQGEFLGMKQFIMIRRCDIFDPK